MDNIDTNVSNYTLTELMAIVNVNELTYESIMFKTDYFINKYKNKNPELAVFFRAIQSELLQSAQNIDEKIDELDGEDIVNDSSKIHVTTGKEGFGNMNEDAVYPAGDRQVNEWYRNQSLTQKDENQLNKITDRKQKIQTFGNQYVPMNREQIATTDTFNLPVKQDSLNPNLKNTINRLLNLDSQFRQYTNGQESQSTNYTCDLSDTLKNTLKLSLYSYQIPHSWYVIDTAYGNTCLWVRDPSSGIDVPISITPGNYTQEDFVKELNDAFLAAGFSLAGENFTPVTYNANNGILTINLHGAQYNGNLGSFDVADDLTQIIFFDFTARLQCNVNCGSKSNHYFNNTLGWIMGYRVPYIYVATNGNTASCILDLNGTKYLILVVDDYNQNHVNNSLVSISQFSNTLKMPSYYSPDLPYTCLTPAQQGNNLSDIVDQNPNSQDGLLIAGKYQQDYTSTQIVLPSAPRTLTNAQLYTINSINNNNNNLTNYLAKAPTSSDILALIPVKTSVGVPTGSLLVEFSGSLQDSNRTYFGPVNIERMAIKLLDDRGNILNLNGSDWCFTLLAECLYQY